MPHRQVYFLKQKLAPKGGLEKASQRLFQGFKQEGYQCNWIHQSKDSFSPPPLSFNYQKLKAFDQDCKKLFLKEGHQALFFGLDRTSYQHLYRAGNGVHAAYLEMRKQRSGNFKKALLSLNPLHHTLLKLEKNTFEFEGLRRLFTNSHMVKKQVLDFYKIDEKKIEVIHNGVEWQEFQPHFSIDTTKAKKQLGIDPEEKVLLFVGNGWERKGLKELLKALSLVKSSFSAFKLLVIGKEKRQAYYQKLSHSLKLCNSCYFLGPQKDLFPFYRAADTCLIPSHYDPFANVTLEALSMGCFVFTSQDNGAIEILNPENGQLIDNIFDASSFAIQLISFLKKNMPCRKGIRESVKSFDYSKQLNKMITSSLEVV